MLLAKNTCGADFDFSILNDVTVIYDLNNGNKSVTNDIENVIEKIIYRDSMGKFDGVYTDESGKFNGFYSINETTLDKALTKVN